MAETAVSLVVDKLASLVAEEVKLLGDVHREVAFIKGELESMQYFLNNADARADKEDTGGAGMKTWVKQVREVAYHIEDVIDEYMVHVAQRHIRHGFIGFFHKITPLGKNIRFRHGIASEIQEIKATVCEIKERSERYGLNSYEQGSSSGAKHTAWHDPRMASLFIGEAEVVGIESTRDQLIGWLVEGPAERTVISVVGMGGLGKTTLVQKVYDNQTVTNNFTCCAWIKVSQIYKMEELLRDMIKQFYGAMNESTPQDIDGMDEALLISKLRKYLQEKRYVIVFDDIWRVEFWGYIKLALPDNNNGSRIIITTRSDDVAASSKESPFSHLYRQQPLPLEKAWELFCKKVFQSDYGGGCPQELEKLSRDIVKKCEGLPLAIVAIGGLLATKNKVMSEWQKLHDSLGIQLESNPRLTSITKILSLSYHDLPYFLKSCFLYFAKFPVNYSISCVRLVRLWIAEGFVKGSKGKTLEQIAEEYLTELIHRSLVQVSHVNYDGKARSCRVHDLMREIILSMAKELSFCRSLEVGDSTLDVKSRRLSIHNCTYNVLESIENSMVRSISIFKVDEPPKSLLTAFLSNLKLLKVLDFEDAPLNYLPEEVGNLFHLRYLSIRDTKVKILPKSIGKLHYLETLDLKRSLVYELPMEINRLLMLRHLLAYYIDSNKDDGITSQQGMKIKEGFGCLEALQKLYFVEANHGVGLIKEMGKLRQLRKLGIIKLSTKDGKDLCASIDKMNHLESLDICSISRDEVIDLQSITAPPQFLRSLSLKGRLEKLPSWIPKLLNVVKINLSWSALMDDPLKVLQTLPNLLMLELHEAYKGENLYFEGGGFQKLKRFKYFNEVKSVVIDEGALPVLEKFSIGLSPQLKEVSGLHHLISLKSLIFYAIPTTFLDSIPRVGQNFWFVDGVEFMGDILKIEGKEALCLFRLVETFSKTYLQSTIIRLEEKRVKRQDAEQWMSHRLLPENLRAWIRRYEQYRWQETRGVDEENLLYNLPKDLKRDIKRHLCLALLMRVPMFDGMDEQLLDVMCNRLKPVLYTDESYIVREGNPVDGMLLIMRGLLVSMTTNGGRTGFFNSDYLKAGDFCGEELLTWALYPSSLSNLPISSRTVKALTEVEAFVLVAEDLKFVASIFRRLHSKEVSHTFRFYSHQWRTWAACFIQAAWRYYIKRKLKESLRQEENRLQDALAKAGGNSPSLGATIYASRFAANLLCALRRNGTRRARELAGENTTNAELDFSAAEEN